MSRFAVALMCLCFAFTSAVASDGSFVWGVNGHPFTAYPGVTYQQQISLLKKLGAKSYRVNISSLTDVPRLVALIEEAKSHDIKILPVLTPGIDVDKAGVTLIYQTSRDFAKAIVSAVKAEISVWELGNEFENYAIIQPCEMQDDGKQYNCSWGPAGGVGVLDYYGPRWEKVSAYVRGLSDGVKAADSLAERAIGPAGWGHIGAFERLQADHIEWEISVWHMYGQDPEWAFKAISKFGKPIWVTEFNHPFGSSEGEMPQAEGIRHWMERLKELSAAYNVKGAFIYELLDESYWEPSFEARMGLVRLEKQETAWRLGGNKLVFYAAASVIGGEFPDSWADTFEGTTCKPAEFFVLSDRVQSEVMYSYCLLLRRAPDGRGLSDYTSARKGGMNTEDLLLAIADSPEFAQHGMSQPSDPAFLRDIHKALLRRDIGWFGFLSYLRQLSEGQLSRKDIVHKIIKSDEFRETHKAYLP
jgi:hypothetical protein